MRHSGNINHQVSLLSSKQPYPVIHNQPCHLLYNPDLLDVVSADLLSRGIFQQAEECEQIAVGGRGQAWFIKIAGLSAVLRAFQRGGLIARFNRQSYLGLKVDASRSFKEWHLLEMMHNKGLPVPRPIAASVCRWPIAFSPLYRARILVERIPETQTLDQLLIIQPLDEALWAAIGQCVRRFHDESIYHSDLNANNILLDKGQSVYLIDFDKCEARAESLVSAQWKQDNLMRLQRSFLKQKAKHEQYFYSEDSWSGLMAGYDVSRKS